MPEGFFDKTWKTADYSTPLVQIAAGGVDLAAGLAAEALPETPGRVKAVIQHTGDSGRVWIRFDGADAVVGDGEVIYPGQQWYEYTASAVSVLFEGEGECRLSTSELGA